METQVCSKEVFTSLFWEALKLHELNCSEEKVNLLFRFYVELVRMNEVMNLTAITEVKDVIYKHFIDCMLIERFHIIQDRMKIIDVGTGAGFPGVVLAIIYDKVDFVLMDSLNKRITFLKKLCEDLKLKNVECIHSRAEELAFCSEYREMFDISTSRAVANLSTLSEYCIPFVKIGGKFISYKSQGVDDEVNKSLNAIHILGGKLLRTEYFDLVYENNQRSLVIIDKVKSSPKKYPRKSGTPSRQPL